MGAVQSAGRQIHHVDKPNGDPLLLGEAVASGEPDEFTRALRRTASDCRILRLLPKLASDGRLCAHPNERRCGTFACVFRSDWRTVDDGGVALRVRVAMLETAPAPWSEPWIAAASASLLRKLVDEQRVPPIFVRTRLIVHCPPIEGKEVVEADVPPDCGPSVLLAKFMWAIRRQPVINLATWYQVSEALQTAYVREPKPLKTKELLHSDTVARRELAELFKHPERVVDAKRWMSSYADFLSRQWLQLKRLDVDNLGSPRFQLEMLWYAVALLPHMMYTIMDEAPYDFRPRVGVGDNIPPAARISGLFLLVGGLFAARAACCFHHNDMAPRNVLMRKPREGETWRGTSMDPQKTKLAMIRFADRTVVLPYLGILPVVIDFGFSGFEIYCGERWTMDPTEIEKFVAPSYPGSVATDVATLLAGFGAQYASPIAGMGQGVQTLRGKLLRKSKDGGSMSDDYVDGSNAIRWAKPVRDDELDGWLVQAVKETQWLRGNRNRLQRERVVPEEVVENNLEYWDAAVRDGKVLDFRYEFPRHT